MLLVSFGSPSAIAYAVTNIVRGAMDSCVGPHALYHVVHLEDFKLKWNESPPEERRAVLVVSDCPHVDVIKLMAATNGPILISCDSFDHIVHYVMRSRDMAFAPAVRFATQVVCALDGLNGAPHVLRVTPEHYHRTFTAFVESLISFSGMACTDAQLATVMERLEAGHAEPSQTFRHYVQRHFPHFDDAQYQPHLSPDDQTSLRVLVDDYTALVEGRPLVEAVWPARLFLDWDRPGRFLEGPVELMGPARFIICGPYLHLPAGRWRMTVEVETKDCFSDNRLGADVYSGQILSAATMKLPHAGVFGFDLAFAVNDPLLPVELRVQLLTGAIEGSLSLRNVRLSRTSGA